MDFDNPPLEELRELWPLVCEEAAKRDAEQVATLLPALFSHFSMQDVSDTPETWHELARRLALRHEKKEAIDENGEVCFEYLYQKYNVDPTETEADFWLAHMLVQAYVPAFRDSRQISERTKPGRPSALRQEHIGPFLRAKYTFETVHQEKYGEKPTARTLASYFCDRSRAVRLIGEERTAILLLPFSKLGTDGVHIGTETLSERAIRNYFSEIETALSAFLGGHPTEFQLFLVTEAAAAGFLLNSVITAQPDDTRSPQTITDEGDPKCTNYLNSHRNVLPSPHRTWQTALPDAWRNVQRPENPRGT